MSHPLQGFSFKISSFKSLADEPGDNLSFEPVNILVGRNNSGKSSVIDALRFILTKGKEYNPEHSRHGSQLSIKITSHLSENELRRVFRENTRSHGISAANDWFYGRSFISSAITRSLDTGWNARWISGPDLSAISNGQRATFEQSLTEATDDPKAHLIQIAAERDVKPEGESDPSPVAPSGTGLTNLIRAFLYDSRFPMAQVEKLLLEDLNTIYQGDAFFERILCQRDPNGQWEIYLQEGGAPVRLSQSGSSLRTIFIILATLRLNPLVSGGKSVDRSVFCVEEPENNLHPALLRRLLDFLAQFRASVDATLFITTHSPTAIDWASRREDSATFHVKRTQTGAQVHQIREYSAARNLLKDLDIRASEILQSNGVIWVEGPSDRIYLRKWISEYSNSEISEGVHYSIMFYGGKLLSHLSCLPPGDASEAISLLHINRNSAVVIDSDRRMLRSGKYRSNINATKKRIEKEIRDLNGFVWITQGKEIENYISYNITSALNGGVMISTDMSSDVPAALKKKYPDKISLAHAAAEITNKSDLKVLDLPLRLEQLCEEIRTWNMLSKL